MNKNESTTDKKETAMENRIAINDGSGRWFSPKAAQLWKSSRPEVYESLYQTARGAWISFITDDDGHECYRVISSERAAIWFAYNNIEPPASIAEEFALLEV